MEMAESMIGTVQDIMGSFTQRSKATGDLSADTRKTLRELSSSRRKRGKDQTERVTHFTKSLSEMVEGMLKGFQEGRKQMSEGQAKGLRLFIGGLTTDVTSMLADFQRDREKMSKDLKSRLAREVREIENYVEKKLKEFDANHKEMAARQTEGLTRFINQIKNEVGELLLDGRRNIADFRNDINKASHAWNRMASTLAEAKKSGSPRMKAATGEKAKMAGESVLQKKRHSKGTKTSGGKPKKN